MSLPTFERVTVGYDKRHEAELVNAIAGAILEASKVNDLDATVLRTGEIASALISSLAVILALSPASTRTREARRRLMAELGRQLTRRVAEATADPDLQGFVKRTFRGNDVGGHA